MGELNLERSNVKFDLWERKLLDLSTRNSLLNLRIKGTSIPLFVPDCAKIEDYIAQEKNFSIISRGDEEEDEEEATSEETGSAEVPDAVKPVEENAEPTPVEALAAEAGKPVEEAGKPEEEAEKAEEKPEEPADKTTEEKPVQEADAAAAAKTTAKRRARLISY